MSEECFYRQLDKAYVIGDAILYVQGLQTEATKLKIEVAGLESSLNGMNDNKGGAFQNAKKMNFTSYYPAIKKISKVCVIKTKYLSTLFITKKQIAN